jgi:ABC-2 type transport system permease protein
LIQKWAFLRPIYWMNFQVNVMTAAQYRVSTAFWILSLVAEPIVYMSVWAAVTREQGGSLDGLTVGQFSAYFITWMLVRHFSVAPVAEMEWRIRDGLMSGLLVRPVNPIHADIAENIASKLTALPFVILVMIGLAFAYPPTFNLQVWTVLAFIPALLMGASIRFLFQYTLGLAAFWVTRTNAIFGVYTVSEIFLSGRFVPLALLPAQVVLIASILPFRWTLSFPVEVVLGQLSMEQVVIGLGIQALWLLAMSQIFRLIWAFGVRQYTAVAG